MSHNAAWQDSAICAQTDPELFFPQLSAEQNWGRLSSARRICSNCTVQLDCINDAIRLREDHGIRAGLAGKTLSQIVRHGIPLTKDQLVDLTSRYCSRKFQAQSPSAVSAP